MVWTQDPSSKVHLPIIKMASPPPKETGFFTKLKTTGLEIRDKIHDVNSDVKDKIHHETLHDVKVQLIHKK